MSGTGEIRPGVYDCSGSDCTKILSAAREQGITLDRDTKRSLAGVCDLLRMLGIDNTYCAGEELKKGQGVEEVKEAANAKIVGAKA